MLKEKPTPEGSSGRNRDLGESVTSHLEACPNCDGTVVDGQALLRCVECTWTGHVI
jgi:hypothetical protein